MEFRNLPDWKGRYSSWDIMGYHNPLLACFPFYALGAHYDCEKKSICSYKSVKVALSVVMPCAPVFKCKQLSSFRAFIDLTVGTCHIQYTFLSLC